MRRLLVLLVFAALSAHAAPRHVVFVDNRAATGGAGTSDRPFATLAEAMRGAHDFDIIFVTETDQPYPAGMNLRRGQMLIGSAYGLDALRAEQNMELDAPPTPAAQGPGPLLQGSVTMAGDNLVAGVTIATAATAALSAASANGPISVITTYLRTSRGAVGLALSNNDFPLTFTGGGIAADGGGGLMIYGGSGQVLFDRFRIGGSFTNAVDIRSRAGAVIFRGRGAIDVADATLPAVTIADCAARVDIEVPLRVTAHARALSISRSAVKITGDAKLEANGAPALEIRDSAIEAAFADVSASGGDHGIVIDKLRGSLAISGGTVSGTRGYGVDVTQSSGVRLAGLTLAEDGSGADGAALHLRHLSQGEIEKVTISGGKSVALRAGNLQNVTFSDLDIRNSGAAAVVLDEAKESVRFTRCKISGPSAGAVVVTQQFNTAKLVFDRCAFDAAAHPLGATHLASFHATGGKLDLEIRNAEMVDNAASAVRVEAGGTSVVNLLIADSRIERLGRTAIEVRASDQAKATFTLRGTTIQTVANGDGPAVDVAASAGASACADFIGNSIMTGTTAVPVIRLAPPVGACH